MFFEFKIENWNWIKLRTISILKHYVGMCIRIECECSVPSSVLHKENGEKIIIIGDTSGYRKQHRIKLNIIIIQQPLQALVYCHLSHIQRPPAWLPCCCHAFELSFHSLPIDIDICTTVRWKNGSRSRSRTAFSSGCKWTLVGYFPSGST